MFEAGATQAPLEAGRGRKDSPTASRRPTPPSHTLASRAKRSSCFSTWRAVRCYSHHGTAIQTSARGEGAAVANTFLEHVDVAVVLGDGGGWESFELHAHKILGCPGETIGRNTDRKGHSSEAC